MTVDRTVGGRGMKTGAGIGVVVRPRGLERGLALERGPGRVRVQG